MGNDNHELGGDKLIMHGVQESEDLEDLFCEIWERESQAELTFDITGVGSVLQTQDLHGRRWDVNNFSNTVWEAAIWMHHFFQDERCFPKGWLRGRRVLEVGAGTGLVGLSLALLGAEVTMTDLPEALPILRHNTEATFGALKGEGSNCCDHNRRTDCHAGLEQPRMKHCRRPTVRQLCWGNEVDIGEVAAAAAARADEDGEWRGFDLIVGADVIYNEPTFPALFSTLSDRRLCSDKTLVYLATMLRGGRHEGLLEMMNENGFRVRALDPTCADELRARVAGDDGGSTCNDRGKSGGGAAGGAERASRAWAGPEWSRGNPHSQKRKSEMVQQVRTPDDGESRGTGDVHLVRDTAANESGNDFKGGGAFDEHETGGGGGGGGSRQSESPPATGAQGDATRDFKRGTISADRNAGTGGGWGYKEQGLGKILAYVARRR